MALKLENIDDRGAKTTYHRICNLAYDCESRKITIMVKSYTSQDFRDVEKEVARNCDSREAILNELTELVSNQSPENEARRLELSEKLKNMSSVRGEITPKHLTESAYEFSQLNNTDAEFSLTLAYEWLKENVYQKAEDC